MHGAFCPLPSTNGWQNLAGADIARLTQHLQTYMSLNHFTELLIDETSLFVNEYQALGKITGLTLAALDRQLIWQQRQQKDSAELKQVKRACQIVKQVLNQVITELAPGQTELEIKELLETQLRAAGSTQAAFPIIVAFGANSAKPHHQPTQKKLTTNTVVLIDVGATSLHYHSDMTRTVWFGDQPDAEFLKIKQVVKQAYQAVLASLTTHSAGLTVNQLDQAARDLITEAGYGPDFIHTTGHGLGLELHEPPSVSSRNLQKITPGMVITIEPGIYLPGKFGYRYENTVWIKNQGYEILTKSLKNKV